MDYDGVVHTRVDIIPWDVISRWDVNSIQGDLVRCIIEKFTDSDLKACNIYGTNIAILFTLRNKQWT